MDWENYGLLRVSTDKKWGVRNDSVFLETRQRSVISVFVHGENLILSFKT
jgi:hypothetical protein